MVLSHNRQHNTEASWIDYIWLEQTGFIHGNFHSDRWILCDWLVTGTWTDVICFFKLVAGFGRCCHQWWARLVFTIEIEIKTFENQVSISRLVSRLLGLQSWYRDWYRDFQDFSLDIETGIETLEITVLILRLVSRLSGLQSWYRDWHQDSWDHSLDIKTGIETL